MYKSAIIPLYEMEAWVIGNESQNVSLGLENGKEGKKTLKLK